MKKLKLTGLARELAKARRLEKFVKGTSGQTFKSPLVPQTVLDESVCQ